MKIKKTIGELLEALKVLFLPMYCLFSGPLLKVALFVLFSQLFWKICIPFFETIEVASDTRVLLYVLHGILFFPIGLKFFGISITIKFNTERV